MLNDIQPPASDPLRAVDWRHRQAAAAVRNKRFLSPLLHDAETREIVAYLRHRSGISDSMGTERKLHARYVELDQAFVFRNSAPPRSRAALEAFILSGESPEILAADFGLLPTSVDWYAAAFFDVQSRRSARQFILQHVIQPEWEQHRGEWFFWGWKLIAYAGNADVLRQAISLSPVASLEQLGSLLEEKAQQVLIAKECRLAEESLGYGGNQRRALPRPSKSEQSSENDRLVASLHEGIAAMMKDIPWHFGSEPPADDPDPRFEACAAELRADEMFELSHGKLKNGDDILSKTFPPIPPPANAGWPEGTS